MTLNCIIIDNDPLQRLGTLNIIKENPSIKIIGEFSSAIETKRFLQNNHVILIVMEVNFPVLNGFDLIDFCNNTKEISTPRIVITSHDESQAFKAFEYYVQHRNAKLGRNTVLILDEAQLLNDHSLIELKNLTNINSHLSNPLTIVLVGQPELRDQVKGLPPLDQRVSLRFHLNPLSAKDVQGYIEQRLRVVGRSTGDLFDLSAIEALTSHTGGIPREVNRACQLCLHFAAAQNRDRVDNEIMEGVIQDLKRQQGDI